MVKKPKQGLKRLGRDEFIKNVLLEVNRKGFVEKKLKKNGDITSIDLKEALGSVLYEFIIFSDPDGSERVRIALRRNKAWPEEKTLQIS